MRALKAVLLVLLMGSNPVIAQEADDGLNLTLPTENDALFNGGGAAFYQHVRRDFKNAISHPWQGGQYGFVRNPVESSGGLTYTRFHEGIDIRPMRRDERGEPLDPVRAIASGKVAYINLVPGYSNYGMYVVVEHRWDGASYFSLYGHLASVAVQTGDAVERGAQLGVMGYTGEGLDQSRAHVHLELNLMLNRRFESWYETFHKADPNRHGIYSGINLAGIDVARLYLALRKRPSLTLPGFLATEETFYKVTIPASRNFELPQRYPWLRRGEAQETAAAWEVSFNRAGVPLKVEATATPVAEPTVTFAKKSGGDLSNKTRGVLRGSDGKARLSESGKRLMRLLFWPE